MPRNHAYTLRDVPEERVCWACHRCDRRGQYRRDALAAKAGWDIAMPDLLRLLAKATGCERWGDMTNPCGAIYTHQPSGQASR